MFGLSSRLNLSILAEIVYLEMMAKTDYVPTPTQTFSKAFYTISLMIEMPLIVLFCIIRWKRNIVVPSTIT